MARTVIAGLSAAIAGAVLAVGLQLAFQWDLENAVSRYHLQHPEILYSPFCGYAYRDGGGSGVGNGWLFTGVSLALALGGIACLVPALLPVSRGSRLRRWAVFTGAIELALSIVAFGANWLVLAVRVLGCTA